MRVLRWLVKLSNPLVHALRALAPGAIAFGVFSLCVTLFAPLALRAQQNQGAVQWASEVLGMSSETHKPGEKGFGADQALGKPNKCPAVGDSPCAWLPGNDADVGTQ